MQRKRLAAAACVHGCPSCHHPEHPCVHKITTEAPISRLMVDLSEHSCEEAAVLACVLLGGWVRIGRAAAAAGICAPPQAACRTFLQPLCLERLRWGAMRCASAPGACQLGTLTAAM